MGMEMRPMGRLPTETTKRAIALVERSRPSLTRPRLTDPELEARMQAAESQQAVRYARKEDACDRVSRAVEDIEESADGIVIAIDDEDSVVHHADALAQLRRVRR